MIKVIITLSGRQVWLVGRLTTENDAGVRLLGYFPVVLGVNEPAASQFCLIIFARWRV